MGQFDWFKKIGATDEAVAVLNDQPYLFTDLLVVIVALLLQVGLLWYIHWATMKPEQNTKKKGGFFKFLPNKNNDNKARRAGDKS